MLSIYLPEATPSQNTLQRKSWQANRRLRDSYCLWVRAAAKTPGALPILAWAKTGGRMQVAFHRYSTRELDKGNFIGGIKHLLDALVIERLLHDDSMRYLADSYFQHVAKVPQTCIQIALPGEKLPEPVLPYRARPTLAGRGHRAPPAAG